MKHLLDVNVLLPAIIKTHVHHTRTLAWLKDKEIVLCPLSELGFIRIGSHKKAFGFPMAGVRQSLEQFAKERKAVRIPDDLPALASHPQTSSQVTDHYLADLASHHGLKLATFDVQLQHPSVELIS